tara:strand:- start:4 stop:255 length:252 start_codon:yes stop_codon:yes gene_type:complete
MNSKPVQTSSENTPKSSQPRSKQEVDVQITFSWKFDKKAWTEQKQHLDEMHKNIKLVIEYDLINTIFLLNNIVDAELVDYVIT